MPMLVLNMLVYVVLSICAILPLLGLNIKWIINQYVNDSFPFFVSVELVDEEIILLQS